MAARGRPRGSQQSELTKQIIRVKALERNLESSSAVHNYSVAQRMVESDPSPYWTDRLKKTRTAYDKALEKVEDARRILKQLREEALPTQNSIPDAARVSMRALLATRREDMYPRNPESSGYCWERTQHLAARGLEERTTPNGWCLAHLVGLRCWNGVSSKRECLCRRDEVVALRDHHGAYWYRYTREDGAPMKEPVVIWEPYGFLPEELDTLTEAVNEFGISVGVRAESFWNPGRSVAIWFRGDRAKIEENFLSKEENNV